MVNFLVDSTLGSLLSLGGKRVGANNRVNTTDWIVQPNGTITWVNRKVVPDNSKEKNYVQSHARPRLLSGVGSGEWI